MSVPSYPLYFLPLKLPNNGIKFSFIPLKFPNKKNEEYITIILFFPFHSIPSSQTRDQSINIGGAKIFSFQQLKKLIYLCRVMVFGLGPQMDGIQAQWTHYNEFVKNELKSWALMGQQFVRAVRDDRVRAKNTGLDGLMI